MAYKVAVVGATGNVGREMLSVLVERTFPVSEVVALASTRSHRHGRLLRRRHAQGEGARLLRLQGHRHRADVGGRRSLQGLVAQDRRARRLVIDNSCAWRMDRDVPLIVPEVNADALDDGIKKGIIANPNCSTVQLVVALKPLHDEANIKRVVVVDLPIGFGHGQGCDGRALHARRAPCSSPIRSRRASSPSRSPST